MDKSAEMAVLGIFQTGINERRNCFGGKLDSIAPGCEFRYPLATQLKSGIRPEGGGGLAGSMAVPILVKKRGDLGAKKRGKHPRLFRAWIMGQGLKVIYDLRDCKKSTLSRFYGLQLTDLIL